MTENLALNRQQVFYYDTLALAAGQTIPTALGGAAGAYAITKATGQAHLLGIIKTTTAPAAGFPRVRFWSEPGDATALTALEIVTLTVDPSNAFTYNIDVPLYSPFFTIEMTQGAAGGNLSGIAWVLPSGAGAPASSSPTPPAPTSLPATYRASFTVALAPVGSGVFFELVNPALSAVVLRVLNQTFCKPSATTDWIVEKCSTLSSVGTAGTTSSGPLDSANAAATGVPRCFSTAPTTGTVVFNALRLTGVTAGDIVSDSAGATPDENQQKAIVIRAGESIQWRASVAGTFVGNIEWTEASS